MNITNESIVCQNNPIYKSSLRLKPFVLAKAVFNYNSIESDRKILDEIAKNGLRLAEKVNPGAANDAISLRNGSRVRDNCVAGLLAEYVWREFLNQGRQIVEETEFSTVSNQIDLQIISNSQKIEVRSSFPKNGIEFAICHPTYQFDVIGPYNNDYKPGEIQKDFYVRTLFPFESSLIMDRMKEQNFSVFLTGGATWGMMTDDNTAVVKDFVPDDRINQNSIASKSHYRVVPFSKALDTKEIFNLIQEASG
jgi:hypothetical protein